MLTFLRRIRKTLIDTGSTRKYLIYAIGEIALVVIGIMIALQINNWNDGRREQLRIKTYLSNLIEAINDDIAYLDYTQSGNSFRSECIRSLLLVSTGKSPKSIPELKYILDSEFEGDSVSTEWDNVWRGPFPSSYDRRFTEICFERTSYGNIIVVNQSALEEFKNTGLFSYIKNEDLKKQINDYYTIMDWHFSDWREAKYRGEIDEWEDFLRDEFQINFSDLSQVDDPIDLIKRNRILQLEMEELALDAAGRANSAGDAKKVAKELIKLISAEIIIMKKSTG